MQWTGLNELREKYLSFLAKYVAHWVDLNFGEV